MCNHFHEPCDMSVLPPKIFLSSDIFVAGSFLHVFFAAEDYWYRNADFDGTGNRLRQKPLGGSFLRSVGAPRVP